jgi:hypothetical protein
MEKNVKIYLDDVRTPIDTDWFIARYYDEFTKLINKFGLTNIKTISLDHDLGDTAMEEYYTNVKRFRTLNYDNIEEKTGMDCVKFLVNLSLDTNQQLPQIYIHSANPIGSENMLSYINNYLLSSGLPQTCKRHTTPHTTDESHLIPLEDRLKKWDKFYNTKK